MQRVSYVTMSLKPEITFSFHVAMQKKYGNLWPRIFSDRTTQRTGWHSIITCVSNQWRDKVDGLLARYVLQATIYTIWRERNERKHGTGLNSANRLIKWIDRHIRNQLSVLKISGDHRYNKGLQVWFTSRGIN
jgi:hypothetical protein